MLCAPTRAEPWIRERDRALITDTESFLTDPIPLLLNKATRDIKLPGWGVELDILIDRNAVGNPTFLLPHQDRYTARHPWVLGDATWTLTGRNSARKTAGSTATLSVGPGGIIPVKTYVTTFTIENYVGAGTITLDLGGTNGTARSANGVFTESIIAGGGTNITFEPSAEFSGDIKLVTVRPNTAPAATTMKLYSCPDAVAAYRSPVGFKSVTLPSDTVVTFHHGEFVLAEVAGSGLDVGLDVGGVYADGALWASVWSRRFWWGNPAQVT